MKSDTPPSDIFDIFSDGSEYNDHYVEPIPPSDVDLPPIIFKHIIQLLYSDDQLTFRNKLRLSTVSKEWLSIVSDLYSSRSSIYKQILAYPSDDIKLYLQHIKSKYCLMKSISRYTIHCTGFTLLTSKSFIGVDENEAVKLYHGIQHLTIKIDELTGSEIKSNINYFINMYSKSLQNNNSSNNNNNNSSNNLRSLEIIYDMDSVAESFSLFGDPDSDDDSKSSNSNTKLSSAIEILNYILLQFKPHLSNLEQFKLVTHNIKSIECNELLTLFKRSKSIKYISLECQFPKEYYNKIFTSLPTSLSSLELRNHFNYGALEYLSLSTLPNLRYVNISPDMSSSDMLLEVTNEGIKSLYRFLRKLTYANNRNITLKTAILPWSKSLADILKDTHNIHEVSVRIDNATDVSSLDHSKTSVLLSNDIHSLTIAFYNKVNNVKNDIAGFLLSPDLDSSLQSLKVLCGYSRMGESILNFVKRSKALRVLYIRENIYDVKKMNLLPLYNAITSNPENSIQVLSFNSQMDQEDIVQLREFLLHPNSRHINEVILNSQSASHIFIENNLGRKFSAELKNREIYITRK